MEPLRKPYQGITNILQFNWHSYLIALLSISFFTLLSSFLPNTLSIVSKIIGVLILVTTLVSLLVSYYVYDISDLYELNWLNNITIKPEELIVNIHAGFDETSALLNKEYQSCKFLALDFYDPAKHTEVSIRRARKALPSYPNTQSINTTNIPLPNQSVDCIFLILSAHEIRDPEERLRFFKELQRSLKQGGQIVVTEHLRDLPNFLTYNLGAFHFHSRRTWLRAFKNSGLKVSSEMKITPFITTFVLEHAPSPS